MFRVSLYVCLNENNHINVQTFNITILDCMKKNKLFSKYMYLLQNFNDKNLLQLFMQKLKKLFKIKIDKILIKLIVTRKLSGLVILSIEK